MHEKLSIRFCLKYMWIRTRSMFLSGKVNRIEDTLTFHERRLTYIYIEYKDIDNGINRRCNLLLGCFYEAKWENLGVTVQDMFRGYLEIDWPVNFERVCRLGHFERVRKRPIVVTFTNSVDVRLVLSKAYLLYGTYFSINKDFPREIASARKSLWHRYKSTRHIHRKSKVILVYPAKLN